ncbi:transposase [Nocardiopsis sp. MG754419]|uniref:IS110 family transposase n=1 Tax=Nocardiopsis sp. MG754419 TaxID=2259865 RepID=UPI001BAC32CB|nr:transposase [Nocardiopsis sp. MG754419]
MDRMWAGVDIGKTHLHCVVIDAQGRHLMSRRVANDEPDLFTLIADVLGLCHETTWAVDLTHGGAVVPTESITPPHAHVSDSGAPRTLEGTPPEHAGTTNTTTEQSTIGLKRM